MREPALFLTILAATLCQCLCIPRPGLAQIGGGCPDGISPLDGGVYAAGVPFLVDKVSPVFQGQPIHHLITLEDPYHGFFQYYEVAYTTTTLTMRLPGNYLLRRERAAGSGFGVFCFHDIAVVPGPILVPTPPAPLPPTEGIGPRLTLGGSSQFILSIDEYARFAPERIFTNSGDADLIIYDIVPAVENGRLDISPVNFMGGTVLPPGESLHLDFDYWISSPELLRANRIRHLPYAILTNEPTAPVRFSGHMVTVVDKRDDIPPHITPVITLRPCESEQDVNGDGMLDAADLLLRLLGADGK